MATTRKLHSITWDAQYEKRVLIPRNQAGWLALGSGTFTLLIEFAKFPDVDPLNKVLIAAAVGVGSGTLWFLRQTEAANHPQAVKKPQPQPGRAFNSEAGVVFVSQKEIDHNEVLPGPYPLMSREKLRRFCYEVAYNRAKIDLDTWTSNGGNPSPLFNKKKEFIPLRSLLLEEKMIRWKTGSNHCNGCEVTDYGHDYFLMVARCQRMKIPTPKEYKYMKDGFKPIEKG